MVGVGSTQQQWQEGESMRCAGLRSSMFKWVRTEDARGRIIDTAWVDKDMEGAKDQEVRSRICARQFATMQPGMEDLFAGTPDPIVIRAALTNLATDKRKVLLVADVTSAYY